MSNTSNFYFGLMKKNTEKVAPSSTDDDFALISVRGIDSECCDKALIDLFPSLCSGSTFFSSIFSSLIHILNNVDF